MKKLIVTRPKNKEKYYDESNFKIYINGDLAEKVGQDETKEIPVSNAEIQIQAKSRGYKTPIQVIDLIDDTTTLEVYRTKQTPPLIFHILLPLFFISLYLYNSGAFILRVVAFLVVLLLIIWGIYVYRRDRYTSISIKKIS